MLRILAGALALVLLSVPAHAAGGPLVTGKCWCAIGWGLHIVDCRSCTKAKCQAACQATLPKKTAGIELTDISAARRVRHPARHDVDGYEPRREYDRDGRVTGDVPRSHYAARGREVRRPYARWPASQAIAGTRAGAAAATRFATVAVEHSRPADCYGIQWCGCWLRHSLGIADRSLNLAINWARVGSAASPESANVVVWRHHVGKLLAHENGRILIQSGNDGGAVRTRWVSPGILGGVVAWRRV